MFILPNVQSHGFRNSQLRKKRRSEDISYQQLYLVHGGYGVDIKYTIQSHFNQATFELTLFRHVTLQSLLYACPLTFSGFYRLNYLYKLSSRYLPSRMIEPAVSPDQRFEFLDITTARAAIFVPLAAMSLIPPKEYFQKKKKKLPKLAGFRGCKVTEY